jgi:tetratricopeptide (TPR) repeat protein
MMMDRMCRWHMLVPFLVSGLALAQAPPQGNPKAEYEYWNQQRQQAASPEATKAAALKVLEAARRWGDPYAVQLALTWLAAGSYSKDPREAAPLWREAGALGLRPGATPETRFQGLSCAAYQAWCEADPDSKDPDLRARVLQEAEAQAKVLFPARGFPDQWEQVATVFASEGRYREAATTMERAVAEPNSDEWGLGWYYWQELAQWRHKVGDVRGSLAALAGMAHLMGSSRSSLRRQGEWLPVDTQRHALRLCEIKAPSAIRRLGLERPFVPVAETILTIARRGLEAPGPEAHQQLHRLIAGCHTVLGVAAAQTGQAERAEAELAQALEEAQLGEGRLEEAETQEAWAELLATQADLAGAEARLDEAARARTQIGDEERKLLPQPLSLYAQVKYARGKLPEAIKLEEQALKEAEAAKDLAGQAEALAALAALYHESGKSEDGLRAGEKAAELTKQLGSKEADAATRSQLARLYYDLGDREEAEAIEKGLRPLRRSQTNDWAAALRRSAQAKYRAGDFTGAIKLLRQAQKMDEALGRKLAVVDDLNGIAACYLGKVSERKAENEGSR